MLLKTDCTNQYDIFDVTVIGGGASGLLASIFASYQKKRICVLESNAELGKKIYATGNGKCNLLNLDQDPRHFHGANLEFIHSVLSEVSIETILSFFREIGITTYNRDGYLYPRSEQAQSVVSALVNELNRQNCVTVLSNEKLRKLTKDEEGVFHILTRNGKNLLSKKVILCTGGKAAPKTGSDGSGYYYAEEFGHKIITPYPALCQLVCDDPITKLWSGVRTRGKVFLKIDGTDTDTETGELMLTDYGISGICVFQLSHLASKAVLEKKSCKICIDFLPDFSEDELIAFWEKLQKRYPTLHFSECNTGILSKKLIDGICKIYLKDPLMKEVYPGFFRKSANLLKNFTLTVSGTKGFENAQVSAGGVSLDEIDCHTMESKLCKGLYFAGELLDYHGDCGGYNLQWAFTTGMLSGKAASKF